MKGTETPLSLANRDEARSQTEAEVPPEQPPRRSSRTTPALVGAFIVLLLLAIFLPPLINLGHYRHSITASMSLALGRPVYVGGMQLRLLPTPGISMTDLTVEEDPAFGYEPVLHANSVVASLRLTSLWRGRLEVSRISLDEASLNLVRNDAGQWNIGSVLLRAAQIPNAPTAERHPGEHPRFPYIEATDSRIDFRQGVEKKPFSLLSADFSMWQADSSEWRLRLKAQPVRTDLELHLSDTGQLSLEGSLRRAATLDAMPVDLSAEWSGAQLGQVSRLLAGVDTGWRGDLDVTATLRGTTGNLAIRSRLRVASLRRQEFQPANTVDVDATCQSAWHHEQHTLTGLTCFWPVSTGHLLLTSDTLNLAPAGGDLQMEINSIPAQFPVSIASLVRPRLAGITATGTVNGSFQLSIGHSPALTGHADTTRIMVSSGSHNLPLPALHFAAQTPPTPRTGRTARPPASSAPPPAPAAAALTLEPVSVPFGGPQPLVADARFTRTEFDLHLSGQASLDRLTAAGADFGLLGNALTAATGKGRVELNTTTSGSWIVPVSSAAQPSATTGSLHIQAAELHPAFLHAAAEVESAEVFLTPQQISWQNVALRYQGLTVRGSLQFPAVCNQPLRCPASFTLQVPSLEAGALEAALLARPKSGLFNQLLSNALGSSKPAPWPPLHGSIQTGTLQLGLLPLHNVLASVAIDGTHLTLSSLDGSALGGALHGSGKMNLDSGTPQWNITAQITGARAADAGTLFHQRWGAGLLSGDVKLTATGYHLPELISSTSGTFRATWQNGAIPSSSPSPSAALPLSHFSRWTASGFIANQTLTLTSSALTRDGRANQVRGTINFDRTADLTVETRKGPIPITGPLAQPLAISR